MKISLNWLKDFVDIDISPERLAEILITAGLEVEGITRLGEGLDNVVLARILSMRPHPNADRLTLCSVTTGDKVHAIVCGAKNMKEGDMVALALPGAHLPNGMKITKSKIRGEVSEGMLCSETELGLAKESAGIMILPEGHGGLTPGDPLADALMLRDIVFDINLTPNRPDCLSVIGIAREVVALTGKVLKRPDIKFTEGDFDTSSVSIEVLDPDTCPRYTARIVRGIKTGPPPLWMKRRLEASGIRSINNIVDVTNYVMLETGQPLHAFDLGLLGGKRIEIRRASDGERITTLDGIERVLDGDVPVISDNKRPVAVAGVMGGTGSEISDATVDILIESAYFKPSIVRKIAKRFAMHTESSHRFERGIDPNGVLEASDRAVQLILELAGGSASAKPIDIYPKKIAPMNIEMRVSRVKSILGLDMNIDSVVEVFKMLEYDIEELDSDRVRVTPPTSRVDLTREIDLIEEVARLKGYDSIPTTYPKVEAKAGERDKNGALQDKIRGFLSGNGFYEAVTYTFLSPGALAPFLPSGVEPINVVNPLSEDQSVLRTTVIPSLLEVVGRNLSYQNENLRFFEIGRVFPLPADEEGEKVVVSGIMIGLRYKKAWNLPADELDFFDVKGVAESLLEIAGSSATFVHDETIRFLHPGKSAVVQADGLDVGILGEIHPDVMERFDIKGRAYIFEIELGGVAGLSREASFANIPKFPAVHRDIAILVDDHIPADMVLKAIKGMDPLIADVSLFDLYHGEHIPEDKKSLAYSIRYQAHDRTLREEEVNLLHEKVLLAIKDAVGGVLRG
ncbi:MAG TPA: phenylalanine--tRNA ligase subunit beta [Thermodesulfobacteriota bacterium]|nr:phenylalanine--tRNA ligase subunit beta [Thermodesulfobacteriota bacterium]